MYLSFYNLSERPFNISTDPRFLWRGEKHQEALATLKYGLLKTNGFVVLTGDVGTGKTTLVNALIERSDDNLLVANINNPTLDTVDFFNLVAKSYGATAKIKSKAEFLVFLKTFLEKSHAEGKIVLLVIDEAHRLSKELLEEIRLLSNMEQAGTQLINIFLVGQSELKEVILHSQCRALRQRITLYYDIETLSEDETLEYVVHRLRIAGTDEQLFTPAAIHEIQNFTRGYPRLINILCDRAMLTGYVQEQKEIDAAIVKECAGEINFLDPKASTILPKLRNLKPMWLTGLFALIVVAIGISMHSESPVEHNALAIPKRADIDHKSQVPVRQDAQTMPQQPREGMQLDLDKEVSQKLKQDSPKVSEKEDNASRSVPVSTGTPLSEKALPAESSPNEGQLSTPPAQSTEVPTAKPAKLSQPTTSELASLTLEQNNFQMAIDLFEADRSRDTESNPTTREIYSRALVGRAEQLLATSPAEAETLLRKAIEVNPKNIEAHVNLGKIYIRSKDYALAIDAYQNVITLNPKLSDAFFNLAFIYASTGMYVDAEKLFMRVVGLKPAYLDKALFNLAVTQEKLGKKDECLANLQMAVMLRPENQKAQNYLKQLMEAAEEAKQ